MDIQTMSIRGINNIDHLSDSNWYICDDFSVPRKSKDNVVNKFGRSVIDLCCNFNVHIVTCRLYTPFHYRTRGQGSSAALHMEYTDGRVPLPSRG